jgi:DNA-directed RNA polymerase subunit alpha
MSLGRDEDARQAREKAISIIFGLQKKAPPRPGLAAPTGAPGATEGDPEVFAKPVSEFAFSMRIRRALATLNVNTLGDLAAKTEADFLTIKNFGQTSLEELKSKIAEHGIILQKN